MEHFSNSAWIIVAPIFAFVPCGWLECVLGGRVGEGVNKLTRIDCTKEEKCTSE